VLWVLAAKGFCGVIVAQRQMCGTAPHACGAAMGSKSMRTAEQLVGRGVPRQLAYGGERLAADAFESGGLI
jgi:hypothetical protein